MPVSGVYSQSANCTNHRLETQALNTPPKRGNSTMYKMLYILIFSILLFSCSGSDKLAPVEIGDKWGYINQEGEIVINPQFDFAGDFSK